MFVGLAELLSTIKAQLLNTKCNSSGCIKCVAQVVRRLNVVKLLLGA